LATIFAVFWQAPLKPPAALGELSHLGSFSSSHKETQIKLPTSRVALSSKSFESKMHKESILYD
jgi:hypothetical protein